MCYIYICVYIYKSGYIYIYKVAKDSMSQELPLADSKMQSSVSLIIAHNHSKTKQHRQKNQITTGASQIAQKGFLKAYYTDKRCK